MNEQKSAPNLSEFIPLIYSKSKILNKLPETPYFKKAIANAKLEAKKMNHEYIGPIHLLLSLLNIDHKELIKILKLSNIDAQKLYLTLIKTIKMEKDGILSIH